MTTASPTKLPDEARWLEQLPKAVLVVQEGVVAYANRAARRLFKPDGKRALAGMPIGDLLPEAAVARRLDGTLLPVEQCCQRTRFEGRPATLHLLREFEPETAFEPKLESRRRRLVALSGRLIKFQEQERRHIAHELHDEIGQCLSAIRVQFAKLQRRIEQPETLALIASAAALTENTLGRVRSLALLLHPPQLETLGLVAALRGHLEEQNRLYGLQISFDSEPVEHPVAPDLAITVYRIVQEALSNAIRHGDAGRVTVTLGMAKDAMILSVTDDGVGFDPECVGISPQTRPALGLLSMNERARLLGGELTVISAPGRGTRIAARLPLNPAGGKSC